MFIGVDPGVDGAFAVIDGPPGNHNLAVYHMPRIAVIVGGKPRQRVDLHAVCNLGRAICAAGPTLGVIENVQGFGKQNAAAAFVFGRATCAVEMALIAGECPLHYVSPEKWKRELGIATAKENAVLEATRLFPTYANLFKSIRSVRDQKQAIGNAEATLLAYYGMTRVRRQ